MKRFHAHVSVTDLSEAKRFYSALFDCAPTRDKGDYLQWILDDPRINFSVSLNAEHQGLDHLGMQTESTAELASLKMRAEAASSEVVVQESTECCYSNSSKHWLVDPAGLPWEHFHTLGDAPTFKGMNSTTGKSCCAPEIGSSCCG